MSKNLVRGDEIQVESIDLSFIMMSALGDLSTGGAIAHVEADMPFTSLKHVICMHMNERAPHFSRSIHVRAQPASGQECEREREPARTGLRGRG